MAALHFDCGSALKCNTPCMFFDDHPEFLETSSTAAGKDRLNLRHVAIIEEHCKILSGSRVLDIASHDGRWSFAALQAGATHVTGIEGAVTWSRWPTRPSPARASTRRGSVSSMGTPTTR